MRRAILLVLALGLALGLALIAGALLAPPGALCLSCRGGAPGGQARLVLRGATLWRDPAPGFGGLSGLIVAPGGTHLTVLSDRAQLFSADIARDPQSGAIRGIGPALGQALLDRNGRPLTPFNSDAEDLAPGVQGDLFVSFEGLTRIARYPAADAANAGRIAVPLHMWNRFAARFGNTGFETLAPLPGPTGGTTGLLAIDEVALAPTDGAGSAAFAWTGGVWVNVFDIPDPAGFAVSGADLGPDGRLWLLERQLGWGGFVTRVRRFALNGGAAGWHLGPGETLLEARLGPRENYEGISVWCDTTARLVVTLVSDDGFSPWQRTAQIEFGLAAHPRLPCRPVP